MTAARPTPPSDTLAAALDAWLHDARGARAAFVRTDADDPDPRTARDLDLLLFDADAGDLLVQRVPLPGTASTLDLLRLPAAALDDAARLASWGLITHRLLASRCVLDRDGRAATLAPRLHDDAWRDAPTRARLASFVEMGRLTVREVGVTRDWPALARFWLAMTHAAALAALLDARRRPCPSVYTRPLTAARALHADGGPELEAGLVDALGLHADAGTLARATDALRTLHARVRARCPEPRWPEAMGEATRWEYRYWLAEPELNERLAAADALARTGDAPSALHYLRYTAYSVLRLAMLHQRAAEGWPRHIPFLRPETEVRPDLQAHHPDLLPLAEAVLGPAGDDALAHALSNVDRLRVVLGDALRPRGLLADDALAWRPHEPRATS